MSFADATKELTSNEFKSLSDENVALREWKSRSLHINTIGMILSCYDPLSEHDFQEIISALKKALPPKQTPSTEA